MATPIRRQLAPVFLVLLSLGVGAPRIAAQGCVVAHGSGMPMSAHDFDTSERWRVSVAHRWFESDRHFRGTHEEKNRRAEGSEVINDSHYLDLSLAYAISPRLNVTITVPFVSHDRSSVVRNSEREILLRYHTQASGLGDIRAEVAGWLWDPATHPRGNILIGAGLELPSGDEDVRDTFSAFDAATGQIIAVERTVDQSIQPGDGGFGIPLSVHAYRQLGAGFTGFVSGVYQITPEEKNGVPTFRSNPFESEMSIADTYLVRVGVEYASTAAPGWTFSLALRGEGVPVRDLIGGSDGFRRPGYAVSVEPGVAFQRGQWTARLYVPLAVHVNRRQSIPDKQRSDQLGTYSHGDAAFADYSILSSVGFSF